jgi:hypothetical protein
MKNYFQVKVKYTKQQDNGIFKRVSEIYLLEGLSFTDAEAIIYENIASLVRGEFIINSIQKVDFKEIIFSEEIHETYFKAKVSYKSVDEDSAKTKNTSFKYLVNSDSIENANKLILNHFSGLMVDFEIDSITSTPIVDTFISTEESEYDSNDSSFTIEAVVKENESDDSEN